MIRKLKLGQYRLYSRKRKGKGKGSLLDSDSAEEPPRPL